MLNKTYIPNSQLTFSSIVNHRSSYDVIRFKDTYLMAGAAGRRNILREITALGDRADGINFQNVTLPLTPTSPDETVIQHRGHRRKSATYNYDAPDPVFFKTPTKSPKKPLHQKLITPIKMPVRSSPRKRLNATPDKLRFIEEDIAEIAIANKRFKKGHLQNVKPSMHLEKGLKALSHSQLVELISGAVQSSPEVKQIFDGLVPVPDLSPVEERLYMLQRNVYKSFPRNVWGSQNGSFCYVRVRTHLEAFKKECLEVCHQLLESQHWPAIFEYILMAWKFTMGLPDWTNVSHNKIKSMCMKQLAVQCVSALKKATLDKPALSEVIERMQDFTEDSAVETCIKYAADLMKNAP